MREFYKALFRTRVLLLLGLLFTVRLTLASAHNKALSIRSFSSPTDTSVCGSSATLTATSGLSNYLWSTGATSQSITVSSSGTYWWEYIDYTNNQVSNGDFSSGATGFTSSYRMPGGPQRQTMLYPEGTYAVTSNPNNVHDRFASFYDHTTGTSSGSMMVINGASTANVTVWTENISVTANTTYIFSVWLASANSESPGQLNFSINGTQLGSTFQLSSTTGLWQNFTTTWSSGSSTTASIGLVNQNTASVGNDFAMDDVVFAPITVKTINVTLNATPVLSVTSTVSACSGYDLTTAISGYDTGTYNYIITDPSGNTLTTASAQAITQSGTYTIVAQNKTTGCQSAAQTVAVTIKAKPAKPSVTSS